MKLQGFTQVCFRVLYIGLMMMCASCGWQLQGVHHLSAELQPLYVQYPDTHSMFSRALQERLRTSGVQIAENESEAKAVLQITKDERGHRVISVSNRNTPEEYEVYYNVEFMLKPHAGDSILQQPLHAAQTMTYDETHALAKQREENMLSESMATELADQLLRQIRRL